MWANGDDARFLFHVLKRVVSRDGGVPELAVYATISALHVDRFTLRCRRRRNGRSGCFAPGHVESHARNPRETKR